MVKKKEKEGGNNSSQWQSDSQGIRSQHHWLLKRRITLKSTRQKGNQFQDFCAAWLEEQGYDVRNQKTVAHRLKTGIWVSLAADIFGCDIIAMKSGEKPLFIQATLHSAVQKRLDELKKYSWPLDYVRVQVWQKKDKEVNIKEFDGEELYNYAKIIRRKLYIEEEWVK